MTALSVVASSPVWECDMTENTQLQEDRRSRLLEAASREMARFERQESEFRKKDREERAAALRLPLDQIN